MVGLWTILWTVGCQPEPTGLVNGDITSIRVEPSELTLVTTPDEPATADFVAYATMIDGSELEMDLLSWKVSNFSAGDIDEDGLFETVDTNGGITDIIAQSFGVEGSARVTVIFTEDVVTEGLDEELPTAFKTATASDDEGLQMTYPLDNVIIPRNLEGLGFSWDDTGASIHRRERHGWQYDAGLNAVVFDGFAVPPPGADIVFRYALWIGTEEDLEASVEDTANNTDSGEE